MADVTRSTIAGRAPPAREGDTGRALVAGADRPTLVGVDTANDISEFLTSRRARVTPEQAGLPSFGHRRVPGLRREEVASLAGVSVEYYKRMERGNATGVSESVLQARQRLRASVQRVVDSMGAPATVGNGRLDFLGANRLGRALFAPVFESPEQPANAARFAFLDPVAPDFYLDWGQLATDLVAALRSEAGRSPRDRGLSDLVGELSTRSEDFRVRWASHNVRFHRTGTKRLRHPEVGELTLTYENLELPGDGGLSIAAYTAEPGTPSAEALDILASWTATADHPDPSEVGND